MVGLIALIAPFAVAVRYLRPGDAWPLAILLGVKHALAGVAAINCALILLAVGVETACANASADASHAGNNAAHGDPGERAVRL